MAVRVIKKSLAGSEDLLLGFGTELQVRNDKNIEITKINASNIPYDETKSISEFVNDTTKDINSITKKVDTLADMRAMNELPETVWCSGYHSKNDGAFGSHFYRLKGLKTAETDNCGTVIIISVGGSDYVYELQYSGAVNVRWFGAKGDGVTDDTLAIQNAIEFIKLKNTIGTLYVPTGRYVISATIHTSVGINSGQVGIIGDGQFATVFLPNGDFTAIHLETSYVDSSDFSVEWSSQDATTIPTTRIGIEFAGLGNQFAYSTVRDITVMYAYRSFILKDNIAGILGTTYLTKLKKLTSFKASDYGFHINSKTGSTTLIMEQCYVNGGNSLGVAYGKGIYIKNVNDVLLTMPVLDLCLNAWMFIEGYNTLNMISVATESCKISSASATAILLNGPTSNIQGLKLLGTTLDTSGMARIVFYGANAKQNTISNVSEQDVTVGVGTTKYTAVVGAARTLLSVPDKTIPYLDILDSGYHSNITWGAIPYTRVNTAPNYGLWERGDILYYKKPSASGAQGVVCVDGDGTNVGTWKIFGTILA